MKIEPSENAKILMVDVFQADEAGKPAVEFELQHGPAPRNEVLKQHHSLKAYPAILAIDERIDSIVASLGQPGQNVDQQIIDWEFLSSHASKIMAQAIYLDTSDRNSWVSIRQTMVHEPGQEKFNSRYTLALKKFWNGNLDRHLEARNPAQDESPSL
ncbi:hypothetical protein [Pseudomonas amygdali]|uniref:Uncharacterized protein n=2 Tax=Pseudomonas amygdali pv. lachrymans TaxID=53707 RepID=A0ABR5KRX7_PSEAV|nr:hypothetical protein [Pseudomonas amygdali]AXH60135.1 hypothetical protein PLA107_033540 [Pseudomonas amygdali pv. lachrymans str. M301315]KPC17539.1 Uncharacterized protein AC499_0741 [Pseudomonas amygdali pv. lachrymans]RMT06176.1 hypothetical protein ALP54_03979 [Pseudomonas amygdali pv. lachrymans]